MWAAYPIRKVLAW